MLCYNSICSSVKDIKVGLSAAERYRETRWWDLCLSPVLQSQISAERTHSKWGASELVLVQMLSKEAQMGSGRWLERGVLLAFIVWVRIWISFPASCSLTLVYPSVYSLQLIFEDIPQGESGGQLSNIHATGQSLPCCHPSGTKVFCSVV